uniref:Uncharacterized protein n=1 Tax=Salix viminalis TaxID=40686 RepID=A0A6N2KM40_SALVM
MNWLTRESSQWEKFLWANFEQEQKPSNGHSSLRVLFLQEKVADNLIKVEAQYIRVAMGHEDESLDEYVEAHKTCINDLMYFPTRNAYGLSSVARNMEKLTALQDEFENVKTRLEVEREKALRLEKKVNALTQGYQAISLL